MKDLSPKDVARSLGISESSVKRWVDAGALRAKRTAGGHRRIAVAEAVRFARQSGVPLVRPDLMVGAGAEAAAPFDASAPTDADKRLLELLEADRAREARALLLSLYAAGWPIAALCDGPIRAALEKIGTLWRHGPAGLVTEHRATDTCIRAIAEIRALFGTPDDDAPVALGAAPSGDPYLLPSMMASAVLADLGYQDHNLGPDVPVAALADAAEQYRPRIVWLAMSAARGNEKLDQSLIDLGSRLASRGATLILGGRGVPSFTPTTGVLRFESMAELGAFAAGAKLLAAVGK